MNNLKSINQTKLFGLDNFINELIQLDSNNNLPNKILLSGLKGLGKSTLAFHFINYILSKDEDYKYDKNNFEINSNNHSFKTVLNGSNPNLLKIEIKQDKKNIDIDQIRELISSLNKFSLNNKPRFILINNIEFLNKNAVNALLKILEEPTKNVFFILINNNKKILSTLLSRCINFKISLSNKESLLVANKLIEVKIEDVINNDLINYYSTPGNIYKLYIFSKINEFDLSNFNLKDFIKLLIKDNYYKKDNFIKYQIFDFIEFYFGKMNINYSSKIYNKYNYLLKRISDTKKFNLDEESLFIELNREIFNG